MTLKSRYGPEVYTRLGKKASTAVTSRYGPEVYSILSKRGTKAIISKYGPNAYSIISNLGDKARRDFISRNVAARDAERERVGLEEYERSRIVKKHPEWSPSHVKWAVYRAGWSIRNKIAKRTFS